MKCLFRRWHSATLAAATCKAKSSITADSHDGMEVGHKERATVLVA